MFWQRTSKTSARPNRQQRQPDIADGTKQSSSLHSHDEDFYSADAAVLPILPSVPRLDSWRISASWPNAADLPVTALSASTDSSLSTRASSSSILSTIDDAESTVQETEPDSSRLPIAPFALEQTSHYEQPILAIRGTSKSSKLLGITPNGTKSPYVRLPASAGTSDEVSPMTPSSAAFDSPHSPAITTTAVIGFPTRMSDLMQQSILLQSEARLTRRAVVAGQQLRPSSGKKSSFLWKKSSALSEEDMTIVVTSSLPQLKMSSDGSIPQAYVHSFKPADQVESSRLVLTPQSFIAVCSPPSDDSDQSSAWAVRISGINIDHPTPQEWILELTSQNEMISWLTVVRGVIRDLNEVDMKFRLGSNSSRSNSIVSAHLQSPINIPDSNFTSSSLVPSTETLAETVRKLNEATANLRKRSIPISEQEENATGAAGLKILIPSRQHLPKAIQGQQHKQSTGSSSPAVPASPLIKSPTVVNSAINQSLDTAASDETLFSPTNTSTSTFSTPMTNPASSSSTFSTPMTNATSSSSTFSTPVTIPTSPSMPNISSSSPPASTYIPSPISATFGWTVDVSNESPYTDAFRLRHLSPWRRDSAGSTTSVISDDTTSVKKRDSGIEKRESLQTKTTEPEQEEEEQIRDSLDIKRPIFDVNRATWHDDNDVRRNSSNTSLSKLASHEQRSGGMRRRRRRSNSAIPIPPARPPPQLPLPALPNKIVPPRATSLKSADSSRKQRPSKAETSSRTRTIPHSQPQPHLPLPPTTTHKEDSPVIPIFLSSTDLNAQQPNLIPRNHDEEDDYLSFLDDLDSAGSTSSFSLITTADQDDLGTTSSNSEQAMNHTHRVKKSLWEVIHFAQRGTLDVPVDVGTDEGDDVVTLTSPTVMSRRA
ncbi:unnamed protein product [Sympodiomycopsis kandeliae]